MDLRVKVEQIKEHGLSLDRELVAADLGELLQVEPPTGFREEGPTGLEARLTKVNERDILFTGKLTPRLAAECRRCLVPVSVSVPVDFKLDLVNQEKVEGLPTTNLVEDDGMGEIAGTFSPDEANQVFYSGREIDLAPIVKEQLLLALPMSVLCKPDCLGLCQVCGQNLNQETCACDRSVPDPRWAGLKNIKI